MPWRLLAVLPVLVFVLVIGAAGVVEVERERTHARLRRADEEIERLATIAERERIARDLHDLLGHTLSVVVLKSELAGRLVRSDPDRAEQEVREVEQTARTALAEVRSAVAGYRAKGLGAELVNARRALSAAGVDLQATIDLPVLPAEHEAALALALREAVTNVVRHADAHHATIRAEATSEQVWLEVATTGAAPAGPTAPAWPGCANAPPLSAATSAAAPARSEGERPGTTVRVVLPRTPTTAVAPSPAAQP